MSHPRYDFTDRVVVVTGAASGIGRATATAFAEAGAKVVVADIDAESGEGVAAELRLAGSEAIFLGLDVTDEASVEALIGKTVARFDRLDFAFNNAGLEGNAAASAADLDYDDWSRIIQTNLTGVWLCMKHELRHMLKRDQGCIVNTSSGAGLGPAASSGVAYSASKHGVIGLTRTADRELVSSRIRINAICPGAVDTPLLERLIGTSAVGHIGSVPGALARPEQIAESVLWLCSDGASFISGQALVVDGDRIARRAG